MARAADMTRGQFEVSTPISQIPELQSRGSTCGRRKQDIAEFLQFLNSRILAWRTKVEDAQPLLVLIGIGSHVAIKNSTLNEVA